MVNNILEPQFLLIFFIYSCFRDYLRIRSGAYPGLSSHESTIIKTFIVLVNNLWLLFANLLVRRFSTKEITNGSWRQAYISIAAILSEEISFRVISKLSLKHEDYLMIPIVKGMFQFSVFFTFYLLLYIIS
jgi:hypothetical protein